MTETVEQFLARGGQIYQVPRGAMADALGIDDSRFISHPFLHTEVRPGGQVTVTITGGPTP